MKRTTRVEGHTPKKIFTVSAANLQYKVGQPSFSSPGFQSLHGRQGRSGFLRVTDLQFLSLSLSLSSQQTSPMMRRMHFITATPARSRRARVRQCGLKLSPLFAPPALETIKCLSECAPTAKRIAAANIVQLALCPLV